MLQRLNQVASAGGAFLIFALMLLAAIDVFGRVVLNRPLHGSLEITEMTMALLTFVMLPVVAYSQDHIVIDLLDPYVNTWVRKAEQLFACLIGGAFFAIMGWRLWVQAGRASVQGDLTASLGIPLYPMLYTMAVLSFVTAAASFLNVFSPKAAETPTGPIL